LSLESASGRAFSTFSGDGGGTGAVSASELTLLRAFRDALATRSTEAVAGRHLLAVEGSTNPLLKHTAMVALFYVYRARRDLDRARRTADAIWAEADAARHHLQAMGGRPLNRDAALPSPVPVRETRLAAYLKKAVSAS